MTTTRTVVAVAALLLAPAGASLVHAAPTDAQAETPLTGGLATDPAAGAGPEAPLPGLSRTPDPARHPSDTARAILQHRQAHAGDGIPRQVVPHLQTQQRQLTLTRTLLDRVDDDPGTPDALLDLAGTALDRRPAAVAPPDRPAPRPELASLRPHLDRPETLPDVAEEAVRTDGRPRPDLGPSLATERAQVDLAGRLLDRIDESDGDLEAPLAAARAAITHRRSSDAGPELPDGTGDRLAAQQRRLDVADTLLRTDSRDGGDALQRAVAQAKRAGDLQAPTARRTVADPVAAPDHDDPSGALSELMARRGVEPTPAQAQEIRELDGLSEPARSALVRTVDAYLALDRAAAAAYADADRDRLGHLVDDLPESGPASGEPAPSNASDAPDARWREAGLDLSRVVAAREEFLDAVLALRDATGPRPAATGEACDPVVVPPAVAIDPDGCDTTYATDVALLIDAGGNDTYHNNAGGSHVQGVPGPGDDPCPGLAEPSDDRAYTSAALVDLGDGADAYGDPAAPRRCGANGGGHLGAGILVDAGGPDAYHAADRGTNGGGFAGTGLLIDAGGADTYNATRRGTNGGGVLGAGLLVNAAGGDTYNATRRGVNGGGWFGDGVLVDGGGADTYHATHRGTNGGGAAGLGLLVDARGQDTYNATRRGTNGGGWFGAGVLVDGGGADAYNATQSGANGGGNFGAGLLVDVGGADTYNATRIGVNGGGTFGAGFLIDAAGDDVYDATRRGTNGGGLRGAGVLVDARGDDVYRAADGGTNGGARDGAGLLADAGGDDAYRAGDAGTNGGAAALSLDSGGAGLLVDVGAGDDAYRAGDAGTNGGGVDTGVGMLVDDAGANRYRAGGFGTNGGGAVGAGFLVDIGDDDIYAGGHSGTNGGGLLGGAGFLLDSSGDDVYDAGDAATNGGGWIGAGLLVDARGDDVYDAGRAGTNGGAQFGSGFLVDAGGADLYDAAGPGEFGGTNGGGEFGGAGFLLDARGDDVYRAAGHGTNGGADWLEFLVPVPSVGLLLDAGGTDRYAAVTPGPSGASGTGVNGGANGATTAGAPVPSLALLLDATGQGDVYCQDVDGPDDPCDPATSGTDRSVVPKGRLGAQVDGADSWP